MILKLTKHGLCMLGVAFAFTVAGPANATSETHGLRVVEAHSHASAGTTVVETRISRTLATRLVSPQRLRVAIIGADGAVRAEQTDVIGPAQLARGNAADHYLSTHLNAVAEPSDRLVVEWVSGAL